MTEDSPISHENPPDREHLRIVEHNPSFELLVLSVANQQVNPWDVKGHSMLDYSGSSAGSDQQVINVETAGEVLQAALAGSLQLGKLLVITDDVTHTVTGIWQQDEVTELITIPRFGRSLSEGSHIERYMGAVCLQSGFSSEGGFSLTLSETYNDKVDLQARTIELPGTMFAGQRCVIATADVVVKETKFDPLYRHTDVVQEVYVRDREREIRENKGNQRIETNYFTKQRIEQHTTIHDDGFLLRATRAVGRNIVAMNGLHGGDWSYLKPSGWFINLGLESMNET
jgi:hypothetical protein